MFKLLVVEDDLNTRKLMCAVLKQHGFETYSAEDGLSALQLMERQHIDLVVLDLMMPNMDGYELTRQLRLSWENLPILMVTAKQKPEDKRKGFLVGTDDYMTKPVDEEEMVLRIKALLRRAKIASDRQLEVGHVILDYDALTVSREDTVITLPQKEFYLLYKLLSYPNIIFTRMQLMDEIWGMDTETDNHTLNVHINRLRDRFRDWREFEIITVRGLGYKAVRKT
ncbi:response regulator transcription factor [Pullulanibacillus sp. KACC 23026]|uniref:response regulator transcription factor n=1 Tax=Pullulanibacillus sp. KACC 23026 TaxID=3028315 RepID=UPI0023AF4F49|nr:response regulator transcription factor [Pullulanibacillus sp. KACC 23026]WEG12222.1 response regulator transcription factor [Pullulanibacillus sp. KACC 23026]